MAAVAEAPVETAPLASEAPQNERARPVVAAVTVTRVAATAVAVTPRRASSSSAS